MQYNELSQPNEVQRTETPIAIKRFREGID